MAEANSIDLDRDPRAIVSTRVLDAPRELVFEAWTDPKHLAQWWGPDGFTTTTDAFDMRPGGIWRFVMHGPDGRDYDKGFTMISSKMDFRVGGTYHYGMTAPDGWPMWGKFVYREIAPPDRMVFVNSFSDEAGNTARHPGHMDWPLEMLTTFTFEALPGGKTRFTTRWQPLNAAANEQKTFDANHDSMRMGWTGTLDQLTDYLTNA